LSKGIDLKFVGNTGLSCSCAFPTIHGLSDHDAQYIYISSNAAAGKLIRKEKRTRKIYKKIMKHQYLLKREI